MLISICYYSKTENFTYSIFWYIVLVGNKWGCDIWCSSAFLICSTGSKYRSEGHHHKIYPNYKMMSDLNSWLFPFFKDTILFPIGPLVQKIWGFEVRRPPIFSLNFQKINPPYLGNRLSDQRKILDLSFGGQNQHVCQISLNSERVGFAHWVTSHGMTLWLDLILIRFPQCLIKYFPKTKRCFKIKLWNEFDPLLCFLLAV